jgi:drug/metabolite transporter (DMT)-like permease
MLIALFIGVLGGISPVVNKHLLVKFSHPTIFFVSAISYGILAIIFLMFNQETVHREIHKVTYNDFLIMSFESVVCAFVVDLLLYYILKDNNSHIISVLIYTSPIFTFLFAYLFLNETINMEKIAGLLIIFAGISLIMRDSI